MTARAGVSVRLAELAGEMRRRGAPLGLSSLLLAHEALAAVDASSRPTARRALRAVLCSGVADLERFDAAFDAVFGRAGEDPWSGGPAATEDDGPAPFVAGEEAPPAPEDDAGDDDADLVPAAASTIELLRAKDFADYTDAEREAAARIIARLAAASPTRRSRRLHPTPAARGDRVDVRRTLAGAVRSGDVHRMAWRVHGVRPRRVVLVCDASGSMEPYARMLLQFVATWTRTGRTVEAFAFATRLTRLTGELAHADAAVALARATARIEDYGSGTRIGDAIAQLNREHGGRVGRGAVVVVLSDGWDCGDPAVLAAEMARLRRSAAAVVWLNPHAADPAFEPLTRGMGAALPATDELLAGNCIGSLERLVELLETDPRFTAARSRSR